MSLYTVFNILNVSILSVGDINVICPGRKLAFLISILYICESLDGYIL